MLDLINEKYPKIKKTLMNYFIFKTNPNIITIIALFVAIVAGISFYYDYLLVAATLVFLNGFLDVLDGEIAKKFRKTAFGDFLDHTFDRLADVFILLGITFNFRVPIEIGLMTIVITLLVSYLGTAAHALTKKRLYSGIIGRSDRIVIITIISILTLIYDKALYYGILILLFLSVLTFVQRFVMIYEKLKSI